jgi:hypothetical protein
MTHQPPVPDAVAAVARLGQALGSLVVALASGSAANLAVTEAGLAAAIADVSRVSLTSIAPGDRARLREELAQARATLDRCRVVGTAVSGVIDGCLAARGLSNSYDRAGKHTRY